VDPRILESQKHRDVLAAFWPRMLSRHITALLIKTPITPNQTTLLWGAISAMNSYIVYRVMIGEYFLLPVIPLVYVLTYVLDCVDGEIARVRDMSNPIGGKLLDGICHRATEYSLIVAYVLAAAELSQSPWALPVGLLLIAGEAMYIYSYERRLTTLRVDISFTGLVSASAGSMYNRGERWRDLSLRRKIATIKGQIHYKSIYVVIALAYISGTALLAGLFLVACYKHFSWMKLIAQTLATAKNVPERKAAEATAGIPQTVADGAIPR
jgi:phosphatidylglycerophosphate synthase